MKIARFLAILLVILVLVGCSKNKSPVTNAISDEFTDSSSKLPIIAYDGYSALGLFGAYTLAISPENESVELTPMRSLDLGESYLVSGMAYFTVAPCSDCLVTSSLTWFGKDQLSLGMKIKHPFPKGNPSEPPTARNRLDLDVFDLALLVHPKNVSPESYTLADAYTDLLYNADGFSCELYNVIHDGAALPYVICYENSANNRFAMGTGYQSFEVVLNLTGTLFFDLYLTMGYGASAKKPERLNPTYYVPEFNRKAAWRIDVNPPQWDEGDTITLKSVTIDIYDWNHGATVAGVYPDPGHTDHLSATSNIASVVVEIPGMTTAATVAASTTDPSHNGWNNPMTYFADIANENDLPEGAYLGLVKVTDSRVPGSSSTGGETDTLVHTDDGSELKWYRIPEFATYQTFHARVVSADASCYDGGINFGGVGKDVMIDNFYNVFVTGYFEGRTDFDPSDGNELRDSNGGTDVFLCKYDQDWNLLWARAWGGSNDDEGHSLFYINVDHAVYVTGYFQGTVDFNPGGGTDQHISHGGADIFLTKFDENGNYLWTKIFGAGIWDEGHGVVSVGSRTWITGYFQSTVDFDPGVGIALRTSFGERDAFVLKLDGDGNFVWVQTWGAGSSDVGNSLDRNNFDIYITGYFQGTVDFDSSIGQDEHTSVGYSKDAYITKLDENGNHLWAETWGAGIWDEGIGLSSSTYGVYVTGCFEQTVDFDPGGGTAWEISNGGKDVFLTMFDHNGNHLWAHSWGAGIWDEGHAVVSSDYDTYVTGFFEGTVDFDPGTGEDWHTSGNGSDVFLSKFDRFGNFLWSRAWESSGHSSGEGVGMGSVFVVGEFSDWLDFDPGAGEDWKRSSGTDVFLVRLTDDGNSEETEHNDTCLTANTLLQSIMHNGNVRDGVDENDYWSFGSPSDNLFTIDLHNYSGYDINLYLYNWDCSSLLDSSELPGGSDEQINYNMAYGMTYKILVTEENDGYYGIKEYGLQIYTMF